MLCNREEVATVLFRPTSVGSSLLCLWCSVPSWPAAVTWTHEESAEAASQVQTCTRASRKTKDSLYEVIHNITQGKVVKLLNSCSLLLHQPLIWPCDCIELLVALVCCLSLSLLLHCVTCSRRPTSSRSSTLSASTWTRSLSSSIPCASSPRTPSGSSRGAPSPTERVSSHSCSASVL